VPAAAQSETRSAAATLGLVVIANYARVVSGNARRCPA
jgi:hypothetical protein